MKKKLIIAHLESKDKRLKVHMVCLNVDREVLARHDSKVTYRCIHR